MGEHLHAADLPGNPDAESPHVGATGGSVNIVSCDPEEKRRVRVAQTVGQLSLSRTFVRFDSGRFANNMLKTFLSASHTQADKWKGEGGAKRDHFDAAFSLDLSPDHRILGSVMYNKAVNNNFQSFTLSQINTLGYFDRLLADLHARPSDAGQRHRPG